VEKARRTTRKEHNPLKPGCVDSKAARNTGPLLLERVVSLPAPYLMGWRDVV